MKNASLLGGGVMAAGRDEVVFVVVQADQPVIHLTAAFPGGQSDEAAPVGGLSVLAAPVPQGAETQTVHVVATTADGSKTELRWGGAGTDWLGCANA